MKFGAFLLAFAAAVPLHAAINGYEKCNRELEALSKQNSGNLNGALVAKQTECARLKLDKLAGNGGRCRAPNFRKSIVALSARRSEWEKSGQSLGAALMKRDKDPKKDERIEILIGQTYWSLHDDPNSAYSKSAALCKQSADAFKRHAKETQDLFNRVLDDKDALAESRQSVEELSPLADQVIQNCFAKDDPQFDSKAAENAKSIALALWTADPDPDKIEYGMLENRFDGLVKTTVLKLRLLMMNQNDISSDFDDTVSLGLDLCIQHQKRR